MWKTLADQFEPALAQFEAWGIKGLKVDFMQRDDQPVIDFYHRVARELAKRKMLVDFHGGQRPALMTRTWPNIISTEGVQGPGAPQVEQRLRPRAQRDAAVHAHVPGADGLHAGRDAERRRAQPSRSVFKRP